MKHWTQRETLTGGTVSPDSVQDEMTSAQSSMTALDRSQLPANCVTEARLKDYATHRIYSEIPWTTTGEQAAVVDATTPLNNFAAFTYQKYNSGWVTVATTTLTAFKGGHLFAEWSGNAYVYPVNTQVLLANVETVPRYVRLRILVAGRVLIECLGPASHEAFRVFGTGIFEQGDLPVEAQVRLTDTTYDDIVQTTAPLPVCQAHVYSMRFLAVGRWR
tara:strand:+ start:395 stop:1048 length:654 start_codon:yes stop_codon:yes gene_type:complete